MVREPNIPLFLWIATAILAHLAFGGGADRVSRVIGERFDLQQFAASIRRQVRTSGETFEVTLLSQDQLPPDEPPPPDPQVAPEPIPDPDLAQPEPAPIALAPEPVPAPLVPPAAEPPPPVPVLPAQPSLEPPPAKPEEKPPTLELRPDRRIAVRQHVEDKQQKDNPNAAYIGDEANTVQEETQARITATDQNDPNPTPGGNRPGADQEPGNSDETRVGQSEDAPGDPDRTPTPPSAAEPPEVAAQSATPGASRPAAADPPPLPAQREQRERLATRSTPGAEDRLTAPDGREGVEHRREARAGQSAQRARKRRLPPPRRRPNDLLGLGAAGLTESGVNLNLDPQSALAAVGRDQLRRERQADGERRRSKHRGAWRSTGIERWRAAIENYVPHVKPGNQTALNTARVPFAGYLNDIHNRLHPVFADTFLASLGQLPGSHPMNAPELVTHLEVVLSSQDGRIVDMGVTKTSGVTAFDIGALESVQRASPFGAPPRQIISPDGNVYLHWEFYRNPYYACSTYFAHPFMLKAKPRTAPPRIDAPTPLPFPPQERPQPGNQRQGLGLPPLDFRRPS